MHGGGPGQQKLLAYYELANLDLPESSAWRKADWEIGANAKIQIGFENVTREFYWLDFIMYAPQR
jgi:hypothetical protein